MKKYLRVTCSVCKRSIDQLVDTTHFLTDKCVITFKCEGRLFPVEYRSNAGIATAPQVGITDWRPRGSTVSGTSTIADSEPTFINTSTGSLGQIVIAASAIPSDTLAGRPSGPIVDAIDLVLAVRSDAPKAYRQYIFRVEGSFATINGVESGLEKKVLRFSITDTIEVYLNGVKLEQGINPENFTIDNGTFSSNVPPNTISFNTPIALSGITQVDVVVSAAAQTSTIPLRLLRQQSDESRLTLGSWENVDAVQSVINSSVKTLNLYSIDLEEATTLKLNTIMTVASAKIGNTTLDLSQVFILLAREPYSQLDRYLSLVVPLSSLGFDRDYLKYFVVDGKSVVYIPQTAATSVYPPLSVTKFTVEKTIQKALSGVTNQVVLDSAVIVGPDL